MVRRDCWRMNSPRCTLAGALRCALVSPVQQQADERRVVDRLAPLPY